MDLQLSGYRACTGAHIKGPLGVEREMTRHQRGLVDTCFEEGQFEAAITVLDQLRSSKYRPVLPHIRQLLYIALYPPPQSTANVIENPDMDPLSPRKAAKQQKSPLYPSPTASVAAQRLLMSLAHTNSPSSLLLALPSYTDANASAGTASTLNFEEEDSVIGKEAICIKESKNCWAILKAGFIQRKTFTISSPKPKGKRKAVQRDVLEEDYLVETETPAVVAPSAWPVLEWMITIFEINELEQVDDGLPSFSPLLLSQIPSPRGGVVARWEVDIPLEICFYCFQQTDERRKSIGARLLTLLINLTSTVYLDMPIFVTSVFTRISSFTTEELSSLFSLLAPSPIISKFKIALCQKYITSSSLTNNVGASDSRPKPQVRVQPRSIVPERRRSGVDEKAPHSSNAITNTATTIASRYPPPTSAEILRLLDTPRQSSSAPNAVSAFMHMKFELIVAFGNLQSRIAVEEKDLEWAGMLHDGKLDKVLNAAFKSDGGEYGVVCLRALAEILSLWRAIASEHDN